MENKVRTVVALTILRWVVMLGLFGYGIFGHEPWAIVVGALIAVFGMLYSSTALAKRVMTDKHRNSDQRQA